jgi:peptide/nickel transport system substrate-binding protein
MSNPIDRRSFLARGTAAAAGLTIAGATGGMLTGRASAAQSQSNSGGSSSSGKHANGISTAKPKKGGKLTFGITAEEKGFDPTTATFDTPGVQYARTVFDPLTIIDANGKVQPYLAQSVTPNPDYSVWTVTMRPGVNFHDGTPCDGAAIATNFEAQKASLLTGSALTNVDTISVTGPLVVTVTMKAPWVPFDFYLAGGIGGQVAYIAAPSMLKAADGTLHPVGTGPFVFAEWNQNDHFTAQRNPNYWRPGLPYLDSIEYRPIPDSQALLNSLLSGGVDLIQTATSSVVKALQANTSLSYIDDRTHLVGEPDMNCLLLNLAKPPFNNLSVRQAVAMAISSKQYAAVIDQNVNPPSNGPFTKGSPYYAPNGYPAFNPAKAKQLIAKVAQQTGKPVSVNINHVPDSFDSKIGQFLQQALGNVGIRVSLTPVQQDQIINTALTGKFQAQVWTQFSATDPDLNYIFWSPTQINSAFSINMARNTDPAMETALIKGRQSADPSVRAQAYQQVSTLMAKDLPYIWTDRNVWAVASQPQVENFNNPTTPAGKPAFGLIAGAIWPGQIWLNS